MLNFIFAQTHSSEYMLHKYWARKPYNVLKEIISNIDKGEEKLTVLDPFCGSGVFLREASKLGHEAYGFDVNPIASILSEVTCNPPNIDNFSKTVEPILSEFKKMVDHSYGTIDGDGIRYNVHEIVISCKKCNKRCSPSTAKKNGKMYYCDVCDGKLNFNLKNLIDTKITAVQTVNGDIKESNHLEDQQELSQKVFYKNNDVFDLSFTENKRILSYEGMKTSNLFTNRNFSLLCWLADQFHKIEDEKVKRTALLLLTGSIAQCSRLIAYRNNLGTGGPAWSVPGFWVPPIHLETNPYHHLSIRFKKFLKGIRELNKHETSKVAIINDDSKNIDNYDVAPIDLIFLDPPYGDSVPYVEFSMIWNSFLKRPIDISMDISVSDRFSNKADSWEYYKNSLNEIITKLSGKLKKNGKLLITFNNHDYKAWEALIGSLQESHFICKSTIYQIPAVISSKAQFSIEGSYVSDIYSLFEKDLKSEYIYNFDPVVKDLVKGASARELKLSKSLIYRIAFLSLIKNNIHYSLFKDLDNLINSMFTISEGNYYLDDKFSLISQTDGIKEVCINSLKRIMVNGKCDWIALYYDITNCSLEIGIPDPYEVKSILKDYIEIQSGKCISLKDENSDYDQGNLFRGNASF